MLKIRTLLPVIVPVLAVMVAHGSALAGAKPAPEGFPPAVCAAPPPPPSAAPVGRSANAQTFRPLPGTWQKVIDGVVNDGHVPGVVVIVKSPAWGVRVGTAGVADRVTKARITPDMQFRVGSVTKMILGQVVMQMEQEGLLRLTDPVLEHLGGNAVVEGIPHIKDITVADLLQMKSGMVNYLGAHDVGFSPQVMPDRHFDAEDLIRPLSGAGGAKPMSPDFAPGETYPNPYWQSVYKGQPASPAPAPYPFWFYSNSNYILLGMIAEKVAGQKIEEVMRRYISERGGLPDTYMAVDTKTLPRIHGYTKWGPLPYPHQVYDEWCDVTAINPTVAGAAGAMVSTPWDLLKFAEEVFTTDTFLNQGTKEKWFTFVSADLHLGWEPMEYGMGGLMQAQRAYGTARGHGGAISGYKTLVYYFADADTFFILAANTWDESWEVSILDTVMPLVSSAVTTPKPAAGGNAVAVGATGDVEVSWQAGRVYGSTYDVFWGTDADAVDRATPDAHDGIGMTSVAATNARISARPGETVYWKVDTKAPGQPRPHIDGPLWHFTTAR